MEVVNLGFSGNGKGEPELARLICQIRDKRMLVLDYEANGISTPISQTLEIFIDIIRNAEPKLPILLISKIRYAREYEKAEFLDNSIERRDFQRNVVEKRQAAGDQYIYFLDGSELFDIREAHEYTVDGAHPSDLGCMMMAKGIYPVINKILIEVK